jgi:hypothetical protein
MNMSTFTNGLRFAPEGLGLASLADSYLEHRFYSWLGRSGNRYVCTVFRSGQEHEVSSFTEAAIIGVVHRDEVRRPVCVLTSSDFEAIGTARVKAAVALGVNEWHVLFSTDHGNLAADLGCH